MGGRYLSLLCQQRAGHEKCQRQTYFCEHHKLTFRLTDGIEMRPCVLAGTSQLRALHEFLCGGDIS